MIKFLKEFWYYTITPEHLIYREAMDEVMDETLVESLGEYETINYHSDKLWHCKEDLTKEE